MRQAVALVVAAALLSAAAVATAYLLSPPWRAVSNDGSVFFCNARTGEAFTCSSAVMGARCYIGPRLQGDKE